MKRAVILLVLLSLPALGAGRPRVLQCRAVDAEEPPPPQSAALIDETNPSVGSTRAFPRNEDGSALPAWCVSVKVAAQKDWVQTIGSTQGLFTIGPDNAVQYNTPHTVFASYYTSASTNQMGFRQVNSGGGIGLNATHSPNPSLRAASHLVSLCYANGSFSMWRDGAKVTADLAGAAIPGELAVLRLGDVGSGQFALEQTAQRLCMSGPSAIPTGTDPTTAVDAACGEFSEASAGPCYGCVVPAAGAVKVLALGDSITEGVVLGYPRTYPQRMNAILGTGYAVTNGGNGGHTVAQVKLVYENVYKPQGGWAHATVLAGINDIARDSASASATWTTMQALLDTLRADGVQVKLSKLLAFGGAGDSMAWSQPKQDEADAYNANIQAYCDAYPIQVACVNPNATMASGTPAALMPAYDSSDHIHPSQAGVDALAAVFAAAF